MDRAIFGFTTLTYTCSVEGCDDWKMQAVTGRVSVPGVSLAPDDE